MYRTLFVRTWLILSALILGASLGACSSGPAAEINSDGGVDANQGGGTAGPGAGGGGGAANPSAGGNTMVVDMTGGTTGSATCTGTDCTYAVVDAGPYCGDGIVNNAEVCDDGNKLGGDGCSGTCMLVEPNFECPSTGGRCTSLIVCGNGARDTGEACDDGNANSGDGCSAACRVETGFQCPTPGSPCTPLVSCGDGRVSQGESCDDGGVVDGDGCSALCQVEPGYVCRGTTCEVIAICGDSALDPSAEECDDGNVESLDGCSALCKIEAVYYDCPTPGQPCIDNSACGNGELEKVEVCDDGNLNPGDGCGADCQVEAGYQCRQAGSPCVTLCGDSMIIGSEQCDDGNAVSGDGCTSTCLIEPGYSCTGTPSTCTASECGNAVVEAGETCDLGPDNGLFYGDGLGCSKTCTQEPNCRPTGVTQACTTACGDGNHDEGEGCDDGNQVDGDGCSSVCAPEAGFTCIDQEMPDTVPCPTNANLQCLTLPVIYRDFEGQNVAGGHPDFFFLSASTAAGTTLCVPNASGTPAVVNDNCSNTDATGPCEGLVQATLGSDGKPVLTGTSGRCPCRFTDWDQTGVLSAATAGVDQCTVEGNGSTRYRVGYDTPMDVTVIQSATTFGQWYNSAPGVNTEVRGTLDLAAVAGGFQFSSSAGRTVYDDLHDICLAATRTGELTSGFFPLEAEAGSKTCNIWPYWVAGLETECCAGSTCPVISQWDPEASYDNCPTVGTGGPVPRSDGTGGQVDGMLRNFYFTTEVRYLFRYSGTPSSLAFYGDDDVWVFVNGQLALDLGAPHERIQGTATIDDSWGLEAGRVYEIAVFHADRHPRESNYQLTLSGFTTNRSVCTPRCGDGSITAGEECDNGDANDDTLYNGCTTECKFGPFCGDGVVNGDEQCDDGRNTTVAANTGGCAPGCVLPPACGNGVVEAGEECDNGAANADGVYGGCSTSCLLNGYCGDAVVNNPPEECDDGVNFGSDYGFCGDGCLLGPRCGDGVIQTEYGESCDDGALNGTEGSSCPADCQAPGYCDDGIIQPELGEECDLGKNGFNVSLNTGEYGGCTPDCLLGPYCGDGVLQPEGGEVCDYGAANSTLEAAVYGGCLITCQLGPHCGDGILQSPDEQCDDGNNVDNDRCSAACMNEIVVPR